MLKKTMGSSEERHFFISTSLSGTVFMASIVAVAFPTLARTGSRLSRAYSAVASGDLCPRVRPTIAVLAPEKVWYQEGCSVDHEGAGR
jgi:hypothetical protein